MVKKRYKITAYGNIKDSLRTGKIKFSCVSDMEPFEKTIKITQSKATRDVYCRPAFYSSLENIPVGGGKIKMSFIYNGVDFKFNYPDWVSFTKIDPNDNLAPVQYWVEASPNAGKARMGKITVEFTHNGKKYFESYNIIQQGKEMSTDVAAEIKCSPIHIQDVDWNGDIVELRVEYIGLKSIREPFFSPYEMSWINIQEIREYKATDKIVKTYNVIIKSNDTPDPRIVNLMLGGIDGNNKEVVVNCNIRQHGNPEVFDEEIEE